MAVTTTKTNKPINPRGNDQSPKGYNRAALYSGKALDFDGVNDKITIPNNASLNFGTGDFSIAFVMKSSVAGFDRLLDKRDGTSGYTINVGPSKEIVLELNDGTGSSQFSTSTIYADGELKHVVIAFNRSGNADFYINGAFDESVDISSKSGDLDSTSDLFIGADAPSGTSIFYDGELSGLKMYSTALTAAQVSDLYNNPEKIVPTGVSNDALKLWLPMMEGAGTTAYDGSGNGNHGTISGATYVHGVGSPVAQTAVIDWNKGTNKLQYSEELNNAYYSKANILSIDANATTAPDGLTTAENIKPDTTSNQHYLYNVGLGLTGQHTISIFAKYNGYNIGLRPQGIGSGQAFANFDLQNGTILGSGGTSYDDSSITSFGDGWYRCSLTLTYATAYGFGIYVVNGTTATELPVFSGDGTSGVYAWGAQVNAGATLTPYVRTENSEQYSPVLLPQGLTSGRDITGVNLFENVRKQGALNLDGNSWAEVHDNASLDVTTGLTLEAWVYFDEDVSLNGKGILAKWVGTGSSRCYMIYLDSLNRLRLYINGGSSTGIVMTGKNWYHFVGTFDQSNRKVYINGSLEATDADTSTMNASDLPLEIGTYNGLSTNAYNNDIAQPRIYNRALTAEEIQRNFDAGKNTYKN